MASTYGIIGRVGVLVEPSFKDVQKKTRAGLGDPLKKEAPKAGVDVGNAIVNGTTRAFQIGGVLAGAALGTAITKGFGRLRAMEDATTKIEGLGYAAQEVEQIMTDVQGALDGTMFLYSEGANVAAGALAAGVEQGEELESYLRLTADAATQAGIDFDTMGQMMNKVEGDGRLMGDTIQQLTENGIYVLPALAEEFGVTGEEMRKMVSAGEVDAETFRRVMEDQFGGSSEKAAETMTGAMSLAWTAVGQLGERLIAEVYPYLKEFFQGFYDWVQEISPKVEEFGKAAGEAIGNIIGWIRDNPGIVKGFAVALGMVATAMAAYTAYVKTVAAVTKGWALVQALLNGQLMLNPVGAWIAAIAALVVGIIWAWNNVDWFRDAVITAWDWITTAFTWAWENVISPVIDWIVDAWNWLVDAIAWAWENVLKPVWDAISAVAMWLWNTVLSPVFTWIGDHWHFILLGMKLYWERVLKPTWDAIVTVARWLWESILSPIFGWIGEKWDNILTGMKLVWENVLKPAFTKIGDAVRALKDTFDTAVENIGKVWDKLKEIAAKPIHFVIQRVLNEGLIGGFNKLIGLIPFLDMEIGTIPIPKWMKEYGYARGGWTGPGGKYDPAGIVHADEFVINKESRRRFERLHPGLLSHINAHGDLAGYADGGLVLPVRGRMTGRFGDSRGRYPHAGVDWAVPVGTPVHAALAGTVIGRQPPGRTGRYVFLAHSGNRNTYYGHLSRPLVSPGDEVAKGQVIGLSGNTGNSTGPHLHFETWTGGKPVDPMKYMGGLPTSESGGSGWFDPLAPLRSLVDKVGGWFSERFPAGGFIVDAARETATGAINKVIDWAGSLIGGNRDDEGGGAGPVRDQVRDVAARYGWDSGAQWLALSELIQRESSWNVNAANPRSSARGLFQKMTSIHGPVEDTAAGQAGWGLPYIQRRHGSPVGALRFHDRNNWYADGGLVTANPLFRDRGGNLPPGLSMVLNNKGHDETILPHTPSDVERMFQSRGAGMVINGDVLTQSPEQFADVVETRRRRAAALAPVL